jgi:hypothetical protein
MREVGVAGVGQGRRPRSALPGPLCRIDSVFDRLEPTDQHSEPEPGFRGLWLVAAGLTQRQVALGEADRRRGDTRGRGWNR